MPAAFPPPAFRPAVTSATVRPAPPEHNDGHPIRLEMRYLPVRALPTAWPLLLLIFSLTACAPAPVAVKVGQLFDEPIDAESRLERLAARPLAPGEKAELPKAAFALPKAGGNTAYGAPVTPALQQAVAAYLDGDGRRALAELQRESEAGLSALSRWERSALKAQVLIMMGRAADAETAIDASAALERQVFNRDLFARALRGEALVWGGDYDRAVETLAPVAAALADWRLPTSYGAPPSNLAEITYLTTAQLRSYTALAGQYLLRGDLQRARQWAERAEILFADVHFVAGHTLYGAYFKAHPDSYYGRALNLSFLAAAQTALSDGETGEGNFARARAFFDALGFAPGGATTAALQAWSTLRAGDSKAAEKHAQAAVARALEAGLADLIWRVQMLAGEALLADERAEEAEAAFRSADAAVDVVSGALSSDRAKRRFGVGKEDLTYRLAQFDLQRGDLERLFADLERGRARAFVDMLAGRPLAKGRGGTITRRLHAIDDDIRQSRLVAAVRPERSSSDRIDRLLAERGGLIERLTRTDPDLADAYRIAPASLDTVRAALPAKTAMVYAVPARDQDPLRFLSITRNGVRLIEGGVPAEELELQLDRLANGVRRQNRSLQEKTVLALRRSLAVADWPAEPHLLVVPSGDLHFLPWGAVFPSSAVSVLPTGSWVLRRRPRAAGVPVVLGDPQFGGAMPQLPGARAEARDIARRYGIAPLIDRGASEEALRQETARGASVLHLATHGYFDAAHPLRSAIVLTGADGKAAPLTAADLYARPLSADLVVLSACETGVGEAVAGDDFLGLTRSFYLGGASAVVNSLWPVDDRGTATFMQAFHAALATTDAAGAWSLARDAAREAGLPPSVYGAFVLGGYVPG